MERVDILLIAFNQPELEAKAVESIIKHTNYPYNLTVFDNRPENLNMSILWNEFVYSTPNPYALILDSDTEVEDEWLTKLMDSFKRINNLGAVGPITNSAGSIQMHTPRSKEPMFVDCILSGFCFLFLKSAFKRVGGFSSDFKGFYGQDSYFFVKLNKYGYRTVCRSDVFVKHIGNASAKKFEKDGGMDWEKNKKNSAKVFQHKIKLLEELNNIKW